MSIGLCMNPGLGELEHRLVRLGPVSFIDLDRQIARDLDVLFLIFADRHDIAVVNQNVGGHEHGIVEQSNGCRHAAREFVFVGMRALEQTHRRDCR